MEFAANFTAIDFETANRRADSACQLAAVTVRDGKICDSVSWMIRPRPLFFSRANVRIHGITSERVRGEPEFGDLWPEIQRALGDRCLVAHNATFDLKVLLACLRSHGLEIPDCQFTCTRAIARAVWPGRRRYGLKPLAEWLGIRFRHHDALEDSTACAKIMLAAGIDSEVADLDALEKKLRIRRGAAGAWGCRGPARRRSRKRSPSAASYPRGQSYPPMFADPAGVREAGPAEPGIDLQRLMVRAEFIRPLAGRSVFFSGSLRHLSAAEAQQLTTRLGGKCHDAIETNTDFVVVGPGDARSVSGRSGSETIAADASDETRTPGGPTILSEHDFLGLIVDRS